MRRGTFTFPRPGPPTCRPTSCWRGCALRRRITGSGPWQAICPAHADANPSLSITETAEGVLLLHCWGGCPTEAVLDSLGLEFSDLYPSFFALQFSKRRPGGVLHFHGGEANATVVEPTAKECAKWERLLQRWQAPRFAVNQLAAHLDLPRASLLALRVGYDPDPNGEDGVCWVFPERDDRGRIVGLVQRFPDGRKNALAGSRRGLTIPRYGATPPAGPLYLAEGASDTAALHSVGLLAFGRFSATGSAAERLWLVRLLGRYAGREIVVVGDRNANGIGARAAEALASHLQDALDRPAAWALPAKSFKDVREQIVARKWNKGLILQEVKS